MRPPILAVVAAILSFPVPAFSQQHPDFSGVWTRGAAFETAFRPPAIGPGPVTNLTPPSPKTRPGVDLPHWQGDDHAPILQPWAAARVLAHAQADRAGMPMYSAQETCFPMGVPYILQLNGHTEIIDDGKEIILLHEPHMLARIVRLNARHPANLKPSWLGDLVGHWEGDTLVVDTIGIDKRSWVDVFATPHTDQLHVVERWNMRNKNALDVAFSVDDPGAFTTPWSAEVTYRHDQNSYTEIACAENNYNAGTHSLYPIPIATTPDF